MTVRVVQESKAAAEQKSSSKAEVKEAAEDMKQAAKQSAAVKQEQVKAGDDSDSDVEIVEEDVPEKGSLSGFYRAIRETGRANVLLALQVILQTTCPLR